MKKIVAIALFLFLFVGCSNTKELNLRGNMDGSCPKVSEYISIDEYIPLNVPDSMFLSDITKMYVDDDIIVYDSKQNDVFIFDSKGNYQARIGQDTLAVIESIAYDQEGDLIYVYQKGKSITLYDRQANKQKEIETGISASNIEVVGEDRIAFFTHKDINIIEDKNIVAEVIITDKSLNMLGGFSADKSTFYNSIGTSFISINNEKIAFLRPLYDVVYEFLPNGSIEELYAVKDENIAVGEFIMNNVPIGLLDLDDYFYLPYRNNDGYHVYIYSKKKGKGINLFSTDQRFPYSNDLDATPFYVFSYADGNNMYGVTYKHLLMESDNANAKDVVSEMSDGGFHLVVVKARIKW